MTTQGSTFYSPEWATTKAEDPNKDEKKRKGEENQDKDDKKKPKGGNKLTPSSSDSDSGGKPKWMSSMIVINDGNKCESLECKYKHKHEAIMLFLLTRILAFHWFTLEQNNLIFFFACALVWTSHIFMLESISCVQVWTSWTWAEASVHWANFVK